MSGGPTCRALGCFYSTWVMLSEIPSGILAAHKVIFPGASGVLPKFVRALMGTRALAEQVCFVAWRNWDHVWLGVSGFQSNLGAFLSDRSVRLPWPFYQLNRFGSLAISQGSSSPTFRLHTCPFPAPDISSIPLIRMIRARGPSTRYRKHQ